MEYRTDTNSPQIKTRHQCHPAALGKHALGVQVLAHDLPTEAAVDGLLGLDFFRGLVLVMDFRAGQITLT